MNLNNKRKIFQIFFLSLLFIFCLVICGKTNYSLAVIQEQQSEVLTPAGEPQYIIEKIGQYDENGEPYDVIVKDNLAFLACGPQGLRIIDTSIKSSPYEIGHYCDGGSAFGLFVLDNYVFVADIEDGLEIIDVSTPSSPYEVGQFVGNGMAYAVTVVGDCAFVAEMSYGLAILNISTLSSPLEIGHFDGSGIIYDVFVTQVV